MSAKGMDQRKTANLLLRPKSQLQYAFFLFSGGVTAICLFLFYFFTHLTDSITEITTAYSVNPAVADGLKQSVGSAMITTIVCAFVIAVIMILVGVAYSHKVFGPMVPIKALLGKLKNGDYSARGKLRAGDEFQDIMQEVNDLAAALEKRHGKQG